MKNSLILFTTLLLLDSCLDRIYIPVPSEDLTDIIVDGQITDEPGPYTVKLTKGIKIDDSRQVGEPIYAKRITLFDNAGTEEVLEQTGNGIYQTKPGGIQGVIGREYFIRIETYGGNVIESLPDRMNPVGEVDSIYYEFESHQPVDAPTEYGYRIFIDAHNDPGNDNYLRWKFTGTYVVETLPQYNIHSVPPACPTPGCLSYCPLPCSGYAYVNGELKKGYAYNPKTNMIEYTGVECTCCRCWVTPREDKPKVSDNQISKNGKFVKVEMGYVPINYYTFFEKYRVEIRQMSLSRAAFDYWKVVQSQKEATNSLFQPVTGKVPTNLFETTKGSGVQGIFYAAAITKRQIYLDKTTHKVDIRVPVDCLGREGAMGEDCSTAFPGSMSTYQQPADWK
jgi:hypothetical protein